MDGVASLRLASNNDDFAMHSGSLAPSGFRNWDWDGWKNMGLFIMDDLGIVMRVL